MVGLRNGLGKGVCRNAEERSGQLAAQLGAAHRRSGEDSVDGEAIQGFGVSVSVFVMYCGVKKMKKIMSGLGNIYFGPYGFRPRQRHVISQRGIFEVVLFFNNKEI